MPQNPSQLPLDPPNLYPPLSSAFLQVPNIGRRLFFLFRRHRVTKQYGLVHRRFTLLQAGINLKNEQRIVLILNMTIEGSKQYACQSDLRHSPDLDEGSELANERWTYFQNGGRAAGHSRFSSYGTDNTLMEFIRSDSLKDQTWEANIVKRCATSRLKFVLIPKNLQCCIPVLHQKAVATIRLRYPERLTISNIAFTEVIVQDSSIVVVQSGDNKFESPFQLNRWKTDSHERLLAEFLDF